jgi:tetratricopeptide (TPR) repeat protein
LLKYTAVFFKKVTFRYCTYFRQKNKLHFDFILDYIRMIIFTSSASRMYSAKRSLFAQSLARIAATVAIACAQASALAVAGIVEDGKEASKLYQAGKLDAALAKANAILAVQPKDAQARFVKGLVFTEQDKKTDAIAVFTGITEDFPELPEPYNNLAVLYAGIGNYDKAKAALELAIHTHPSYGTAHENLGDVYAQMARRAYDKAFQLDKSNVAAKSKLAVIKDLFPAAKGTQVATTTAQASKPPAPVPLSVAVATATNPATIAASTAQLTPAGSSAEVSSTVNAWVSAWGNNDVATYLNFYAPDFLPASGETREVWAQTRADRIAAPRKIAVSISDMKITISGNEATAQFRQDYKSGSVKNNSAKTLKLAKVGSQWLIRSEKSGR